MKITRRDLFKRLGGGVALAALGGVAVRLTGWPPVRGSMSSVSGSGVFPARVHESALDEMTQTILRANPKTVDPPLVVYDFKFSTVQAYEMPATYWQTRWGWPVR